MKKTLVLAMAMALGVSASALAANPFSDLPQGHWAYASVAKLASAGIVDGYPDGSFKGGKLMTRYEMAQIVAKALAKGAIGQDDKLVSEFADELDNLGVRVAKLEKNADNVKVTGEARFKYFSSDKKTLGDDGNRGFETDLRTRINFSGEVNDNWRYDAMIQNTQDFADNTGNEETKFIRGYLAGDIGKVNVKAGRYGDMLVDGYVLDADEGMDGIKISTNGNVQVAAFYGKVTDGIYDLDDGSKAYGLELGVGEEPFNLHAGYYKATDLIDGSGNGIDSSRIWNVGAKFAKGDFGLGFDYLNGDYADSDDKNGYVVALNVGEADPEAPHSLGFFANYFNQPQSTYWAHTTDAYQGDGAGFKGYGVGLNYTAMKNAVVTVAYYDTKDYQDSDKKDKRIWTDLTVSF